MTADWLGSLAALGSRSVVAALSLRMGVLPDAVRAMDPVDAAAVLMLVQEDAARASALRSEIDG